MAKYSRQGMETALGRRALGAIYDRDLLTRQHERHWSVAMRNRRAPRLHDFRRIGGADDSHVGDRAQRGELLDRLMRRSVFAQADRVVREHVDGREMRQRRQPNGWPHVVGEDQERSAERYEAAMEGDAVQHGAHRVLADAVMEVAAGSAPLDLGVVRARDG